MKNKISVTQSLLVDLTYHIFAHMKVNHISNLFDEKYIRDIEEVKIIRNEQTNIKERMAELEDIYNHNFNTLVVLNFLPFYANNLDDYLKLIEDSIVN